MKASAAQLPLAFSYGPRNVVLFSGGHSSALVAVEVVRKYGRDGTVLLNHDINASVEHEDIKRFKREVAAALGLPITYANHRNFDTMDQFDVCRKARAFKTPKGYEVCTSRLKTGPFMEWLDVHGDRACTVCYYGFDAAETTRINRRVGIMAALGWRTEYPLAHWPRTIQSTREIGVEPPNTYSAWKHANCVGCLKAGWQHWFAVYATRPDIWQRAKDAEDDIGYSIHRELTLEERESEFADMVRAGVVPTEHVPQQTFWSEARKAVKHLRVLADDESAKPCECVFRKTRPALPPPCTCLAAKGEGHALGCARGMGDDPREAAAADALGADRRAA